MFSIRGIRKIRPVSPVSSFWRTVLRLSATMLGLGALLSILVVGTLPASAATQGDTLSYNPGAAGQCTWEAEVQFHNYTGTYINTLGGNGNAMYSGVNAAPTDGR